MSLLLTIALISAAAPAKSLIGEDQALDLVAKAIRQVYPNEPLRCFSFMTEGRSRKTFDIAVRENHKRGCGGDPSVMPVRGRFRVGRSPIRLWQLDPIKDTYLRCQLAHRRPICARLSYE